MCFKSYKLYYLLFLSDLRIKSNCFIWPTRPGLTFVQFFSNVLFYTQAIINFVSYLKFIFSQPWYDLSSLHKTLLSFFICLTAILHWVISVTSLVRPSLIQDEGRFSEILIFTVITQMTLCFFVEFNVCLSYILLPL